MSRPGRPASGIEIVTVEIVRTTDELRARRAAWRAAGETVGLVPTMGALHEGHLSLVRRSLAGSGRTCVTMFVNPRQFGPTEDFAQYPRDETADAALLDGEGADLLFAPAADEMYPQGFATGVSVAGIGDVLEGAFRPGFFAGVATVVAKLLLQALPDRAFFGEKDYQQLLVIRRMVADLAIPVEIVGCPTVREADGLAISSRNAYLTAAERRAAPALFRVLGAIAERLAGGAEPAAECRLGRAELLAAGFQAVDYLEVRHAETLEPLGPGARSARLLAAARLGATRLIDNVAV